MKQAQSSHNAHVMESVLTIPTVTKTYFHLMWEFLQRTDRMCYQFIRVYKELCTELADVCFLYIMIVGFARSKKQTW